ncbi:hypothetical protein FOL46_001262 [Perkinsus olseni]|uniref:Uncharacterized protein n=1 Tax=Perkinsus olseni TaxID=32597 RepID=A0A7J6MDM0_PEROL|nr:hypothetical protein FOL46_001262 [Perkinsus olseni]
MYGGDRLERELSGSSDHLPLWRRSRRTLLSQARFRGSALLMYRLGAFVQRESTSKKTIETLEDQLNGLDPDGTAEDEYRGRMAVLRQIVIGVVALDCGCDSESNTAKVLQDQEKDLMRAFRARMRDVSKELEDQKEKKGNFSSELQARHRELLAELRTSRELAQSFDRKNQQLEAENKRLTEALETREDDRLSLLKELVATRREAGRLREILKQREESPGASRKQGNAGELERPNYTLYELSSVAHGMPGGGRSSSSSYGGDGSSSMFPSSDPSGGSNAAFFEGGPGSEGRPSANRGGFSARSEMTNRAYERELRYRRTIEELRDQVSSDKLALRSLQDAQERLLQQRSEIEVFLQQCIDDVKNEIAHHRKQQQKLNSGPAPLVHGEEAGTMADRIDTVHDLSAVDRERALELLLSQERVVKILHQKVMESRERDHDRCDDDRQSSSLVSHPASGSFPSQLRLTDPDPPPTWWNDEPDDSPQDEALSEAPEYGTSEIIYGDYQITDRASGQKRTAEVFGGATEDLEEMRYQSRKCSSPEDRLVAALPRAVEECERFFREDPAFVPGKTLFIHHDAIETKREKAIRLCQAGLRGMAIDGDYRVYMNYHINRGIAVASAASMGEDTAESKDHTVVWTFDMPEAPLDEDGQAVLVIELKLLRSDRPSADHFPTIISIAETFGQIARDPTSRRSPNWSPQPLLDCFDPHLDVLRLAFSDKHGQNVGVANSLPEMPSVVRRAIDRLLGSQYPVVLRPAGRPACLIGGEFFFGVLEMDAYEVDDSDGNSVKMALLVYGRESHVVEMNFFQQQDACSAQNFVSFLQTPQAFIETVVEPLVLAHVAQLITEVEEPAR